MPVYKQANGGWMVKFAIKGSDGKFHHKTKRGFVTKREAQEWEAKSKLASKESSNMLFKDFIEVYVQYLKPRVKLSTFLAKTAILQKHITPYFCNMSLDEIDPKTVSKWQTTILNGSYGKNKKPYSSQYIKLANTELKNVFNYACKYYGVKSNPVKEAGTVGSESQRTMDIWTVAQFNEFLKTIEHKTIQYYCFKVLFYLGLRVGEALALSPSDIDFEKKEVMINKTYHRLQRQDVITSPKTKRSNRKVLMPDFLARDLLEYIRLTGQDINSSERMFPVGKTALAKTIKKAAKKTGLPQIRIHDLRHSHASLLVEMGYSIVAVADRLGHSKTSTSLLYSHLYPTTQQSIVSKLDQLEEVQNNE